MTDRRDDVLQLCPDMVAGKYVAVTSFDSGPLPLSEAERSAGWTTRCGIAYSPKIQHADMVPLEYFSELYIFESAKDLGILADPVGNIFKQGIQQGQVWAFVNFDFGLHDSKYIDLAALFWQQLGWIESESYLAVNDYLTFVTANRSTFDSVQHRLRELPSLRDSRF